MTTTQPRNPRTTMTLRPVHHTPKRHSRLAAVAAALGALVALPAGASAASPSFAQVGSLPPASCSLAGSVRTCDLYAKPGTTHLPGLNNVPVWAFVGDDGQTPNVPGGPVLVANQGETVHIVLHNELPTGLASTERLALAMPQLHGVPDSQGVLPGASKTYSFPANDPGTFVYEAGGTVNARHQTAMGLYGAIVVRPASGASAATLATTGFADPNANLSITAVTSGPDGNAISVAFVDPLAGSQPLSVSVLDSAISVSLATDGTGAITSTAGAVAAATPAPPAASALAPPVQRGDGSGVVAPSPAENLSGGTGMAYGPAAPFEFDDEAVLVTSELDPVLNQAG